MSFTGDLEHLPIVDVIQLMHSTRKSGILTIRGRKGESQLILKDGFIVSASHLNGTVRIGQVLVERGAISQEYLDRALAEQERADKPHPLITTLLELGLVDEKAAYAALQSLIELTIVEVLTWKSGTFLLKPNPDSTSDDYQYCPAHIREINIDTQGVLMDALRIFDEKVRDGELSVEEDVEITEEDLGLADLDQLDRQIPGVFSTIDDRRSAGHVPPPVRLEDNLVRRLNELIGELATLSTPPQAALAQLQYAGRIFPRALTLVVRAEELIAEKGVGLARPGEISGPLGHRMPIGEDPLLQKVIQTGELHWGSASSSLREHLFRHIGPDSADRMLLLPARAYGRTVFLTYADFGSGEPREIPMDLLEMMAGQVGHALERMLPQPSTRFS